VVLAGGQDSRLGGEGKATVEVARRPLLAYVLEAMTGALDEVAVAAKASTACRARATATACACPAAHPWRCGPSPTSPRHPLAGLPSRA